MININKMKLEQMYLTEILPSLKFFKICEIYGFELRNLEQELAESINQKNIYTALDLPDFKHIKEKKLESLMIKLACKKLKLGDDIIIETKLKVNILTIDNEMFQLIFFPSGTVPEVDLKFEKLIFFMYQPKFKKIHYCGKLVLKNLSKESTLKFYNENCHPNTQKFINFKILSI
jgi:hypothetical protein